MQVFTVYDINPNEIGYVFFRQRQKLKLSIAQVSKATKISGGCLSQFENGLLFLSFKKLITLKDFLKLDIKFCTNL